MIDLPGQTRAPKSGPTIPAHALAALLLALLALDNLLLPAFLGLPSAYAVMLIVVICGAVAWLAWRPVAGAMPIPLRVVGISLLISLTVFILGGEGRLLYANTDWQVRDALLNDMATLKWPFAYMFNGTKAILRAPLGMYLLPSLAGRWHEWALLLSNTLRLTLLLSLGWQLFDSAPKRRLALVVLLMFSGWDIAGTILAGAVGRPISVDHIEWWSEGFQYSSDITLAFWVPNHALAGWTCALTFELWRRGKAPVGWFAAAIPLTAIWSPLALMGAVPFAAIAGLTVLVRREFTWRDVALAAIALAVAIPSLRFLALDAATVGSGRRSPGPLFYLAMMAFEVLPFIVPPLFSKATQRSERVMLWVVLLCLLFMPFYGIGQGADFQMRASIMPLALMAIAFIGWLARLNEQTPPPRAAIAFALITLLIGAITPALEIHRALVNRPAPAPLCSLAGVWTSEDSHAPPTPTYMARNAALPAIIRDFPVRAGLGDPARCWDREWMEPRRS